MRSVLRAATLTTALTLCLVACGPSEDAGTSSRAGDATAGATPETRSDAPPTTRPTATEDPASATDPKASSEHGPVPPPPPPDTRTPTTPPVKPPTGAKPDATSGSETPPAPPPEPTRDPPPPPPPPPPGPTPDGSTPSEPVAPPPATEVPGVVSRDAFVGSSVCQKCHFKEHREWKKSPLASAMVALAPTPDTDAELTARKRAAGLDPARDYRSEEKCVRCHTTGFGAEGGYPRDPAASADAQKLAATMGSVSCEACHGAGGRYAEYKTARIAADKDAKFTREELVEQGLVVPTRENCATCHNAGGPTHATDTFDFGRDKERVHGKPKR